MAIATLFAGCTPLPPLRVTPTPAITPTVVTVAPLATPRPFSTPAPQAATPSPPPAPATPAPYTVQAGDTLLGIAAQHHVSMAAIQLINDLGDSTLIRAGQALIIPPPLSEDESLYWIVHVAQPGESLSKIAQAYGLAVDDLLRTNSIADPALIGVGQALVIPLETLAVAQAPTPAPEPTLPPASTALPSRLPGTATAVAPPATVVLPPEDTPTPPPQPQPTVAVEMSAWASQVVELVNRKRVEAGLPALAVAPELMQAAQAHAQDCSQRGWGSHVGSDGANLLTRVQRTGYAAKAWGENWVQALDPLKAVDWWYDEIPPNDPHRKNILSPRYGEIGVGIAPAGNGYYFIADFGQR